ncbi:TraK domain-containing protein [Azomonas macrocytogenes]|uniref:Conjugal transfer pilus assembly protein TraK n=1 Tax=Azomonas macrocytogenes TaxID=69962 RepID=A0A839T8A9_AZOMA|nr:type-F conjugative transfer system secretin TraK [Azomonas macrocytogenes]MBB3105328.1 conjugal transfer pilus assembly protein TraK [Azomonas macrocytogenes]
MGKLKTSTLMTCTASLLALVAQALAADSSDSSEIPVVPAQVLTQNVPRPIDASAPAKQKPAAPAASLNGNPNTTLVMKPGANLVTPISIGHLNRLVTPFTEPAVNTTSAATTKVAENVVYIETDSDVPVTMFITEKGNEAQALSLTLVPQEVPPREIVLKLSESMGFVGRMSSNKAERWETSQPYIETIRTLFRHLALGDIPQGYAMTAMPQNQQLPRCAAQGLAFDFEHGQLVMGHSLKVLVGVAQNLSNRPIEIKESVCGSWDVAAVAAWPHNVLEPGARTEVYVAQKQSRSTAPTTKRPSLVER